MEFPVEGAVSASRVFQIRPTNERTESFPSFHNSKQHLLPTPKCLYNNTVAPVYSLCLAQAAQPVRIEHNRYAVMSNNPDPTTDPSHPVVYQIRLKGHLGSQWADWFGGLTITLEEGGDTLLTGPVVDQAALHGLLRAVRDLGMPLVSVSPVKPAPPTTLGTGQADVSDIKS